MKAGFGKSDITPRVGVELCGYGPYLNRASIAVRDRLWARAMAVEQGGVTVCLVSCDLIALPKRLAEQVRRIVVHDTDLPGRCLMVHCTHTHSGPGTGAYIGWGEADAPYLEGLPRRIAAACVQALAGLQEATLRHAAVPCEDVVRAAEGESGAVLPDEDALVEEWRPSRPECRGSVCHIAKFEADGRTVGFLSRFGCHPVVSGPESRYIHGDFCGLATNMIEGENPGAIGLFLQGAAGGVHTAWVRRPEAESLPALDIFARRYARAVRAGLSAAQPASVDVVKSVWRETAFTRKPWTLLRLRAKLAEKEGALKSSGGSDSPCSARMAMMQVVALRRLVLIAETGSSLSPPLDIHGLRIGPLALLGSPFEVSPTVERTVRAAARSAVPLVLGLCNDAVGYAPDVRAEGDPEEAPLICGSLPFENAAEELARALLQVDSDLNVMSE